ncbi:nitronate monooxygenase [Candidatus Sumerlaeota bacterium]|nr:nitronate monooxygenase [Candidatus Sumerlaeota bacterium]
MFKTAITEMFGIEYPIIQGGLMWLARAELAAAVAEAGGIGFMTALTHPKPAGLRDEIKKVRDLTDKPFGVNITFLPSLRPHDFPAYILVCIDEGVKFIETAGRNPQEFLPAFKDNGMLVIHKCTSVRHAIKAQKIGCDAVSIDGFECAGHPGEDDVTSLILIPLTKDAIDIPVVSSGGFGDGRGLVASLALGADGMNMGTRFVATKECPVHENVKQALVDAGERDTAVLMRTLRNTARFLRNKNTDKVLEIEARGNATIDDIKQYMAGTEGKKMIENGDMNNGVFSAGQVIGLIKDIPTVQELFDRILAEAREIMTERLPGVIADEAALKA